jgi:hypothetical protein
MKHLIKLLLLKAWRLLPRNTKRAVAQDFAAGLLQVNQNLLRLQYQSLAREGVALPSFGESQFRVFSQNGEDGILLLIFAIIGVTNKRSVEICAGAGIECNTANLIVNSGWEGLLIDGNRNNIEEGTGEDHCRQCQ